MGHSNTVRRACRILYLLAACTLCAAAAADEYRDGMAAYESGDYQEAYDLFSSLFRQNPESEQASFGLGLAANAIGKLSHALFAFERVLMLDPSNHRARLELARTYYAMGHPALALAEFEKVYETNPPESVRRNIELYMQRIRSEMRRWRMEGLVGVGAIYDDNVNFGPVSRTVDTLIGELEVVSNALPVDTWGESVNAGVSCTYDFGENGRWLLAGGISGYQNWLDEAPEQELGFGRAVVGLRRLGARSVVELPARADLLFYGHEELLHMYALDPVFAWASSERWHLISQANLEYRDYQDTDERDAVFGRASETVKRLWDRGRHSLALNVNGFYEDAHNEGFSNYGWEVSLVGELGLPGQVTLHAGPLYRRVSYQERLYADLQDEARDDEQVQVVAGARKKIGRRWELEAACRYVNNTSNFGLYEYERNIATVTTFVRF